MATSKSTKKMLDRFYHRIYILQREFDTVNNHPAYVEGDNITPKVDITKKEHLKRTIEMLNDLLSDYVATLTE